MGFRIQAPAGFCDLCFRLALGPVASSDGKISLEATRSPRLPIRKSERARMASCFFGSSSFAGLQSNWDGGYGRKGKRRVHDGDFRAHVDAAAGLSVHGERFVAYWPGADFRCG